MRSAGSAGFDPSQLPDADDWGAASAGHVPQAKSVGRDPVRKGAEAIALRVAGIDACFWSAFTTRDMQGETMIAPRILGRMGW